jgi:ribosomal protein L16 Arg81 hydroxylase
MRRLHLRVEALGDIQRDLQYELGHPVNINAYCSWPGKSGFRSHYDPHEVFVLQVSGFKEWQVFGETIRDPLPTQRSSGMVAPTGMAVLSCVLSPGDALYIPRGHWHQAVARFEQR